MYKARLHYKNRLSGYTKVIENQLFLNIKNLALISDTRG